MNVDDASMTALTNTIAQWFLIAGVVMTVPSVVWFCIKLINERRELERLKLEYIADVD